MGGCAPCGYEQASGSSARFGGLAILSDAESVLILVVVDDLLRRHRRETLHAREHRDAARRDGDPSPLRLPVADDDAAGGGRRAPGPR